MIADFVRPFHLTRRDKSDDDHCKEVRANVCIKEICGSTCLNLENAHDNALSILISIKTELRFNSSNGSNENPNLYN